uniref:Uncharacterized protein n=1 Tax=Panagrolaimus sp. PS1159 TaxID=55785 RepID=A0AC35GE98_9BILA
MAIRLNDLVLSLYECATSTTEEEVRAKVKESFLSIGKKQPTLFLEASHAFVLENTRLNASNHAYVLSSIAAVLDGSSSIISQIDEQRLLLTINLAIQEMLMSK